ncbi:uncharacterized protein LOC133800341 [Humulus lupulus]|uniref:uncharacterized protein LOC133800341 n=1 Tax=Humulus lupulus TaxID=3486 RepID=UPI002B4141C5|nr:uncharacterized protein LOC133800341 [Humulus lupulus]
MAEQHNVYIQSSSEDDTPCPRPSSTLIQPPTPRPPSWPWSSSSPSSRPQDSHPLYPWAILYPCVVRSYDYMLSNGILVIKGHVQCKICSQDYEMQLDLMAELAKLRSFIERNKDNMRERAPPYWLKPILPTCPVCGRQNSVKPVIDPENDDNTNWLFLLLGQLLGCCTLEQLKFFCNLHGIHRSGAKDRLLFSVYLNLCKQLDPSAAFDL